MKNYILLLQTVLFISGLFAAFTAHTTLALIAFLSLCLVAYVGFRQQQRAFNNHIFNNHQ